MGIFRRGKNTDTTDAVDLDETVDAVDSTDSSDGLVDGPNDTSGDSTDSTDSAGTAPAYAERVEGQGPFDSSDVDLEADGRLDLGGLRIQGVPGMELRLEVDEAANQVVGATAVIGDSAVQIQAFAAPKTMGIWDDIRAEIAESILAQGGTADEGRGPFGIELRTRMPSAGPDGRTVFAPARFAGVDGPRWFLRAVFSGRAAIEDEAAAPLLEVVRSTVVVRGDGAMAPREMLVLKLPDQVEVPEANRSEANGSSADDEAADARRSAGNVDDLKPFERGPEITEVR
ncbi:DUF3710 domain-containing protein [Pedococcus bigeumensis]|uniref:DUF3710 domain-containing protein n=1 Tax=Pedococcus bigeumensis TaxID=433644 RepID=UPI001F5037B1|nr:DUF3710 domain-containing protein [Pedococcus bigeumensis]